MKLRAIYNHIIFQFEDEALTYGGVTQFREKTPAGILIVNYDRSVKRARWGNVISVGPKVLPCIKSGMRILIEPLKWSSTFMVNGEKYWRTDSDNVMGIDEDNDCFLSLY